MEASAQIYEVQGKDNNFRLLECVQYLDVEIHAYKKVKDNLEHSRMSTFQVVL